MIFYIKMINLLHLDKNRKFVWYNDKKYSGCTLILRLAR